MKLKDSRGRLTAYAMACGHVEVFNSTVKTVRLHYSHCCYFVTETVEDGPVRRYRTTNFRQAKIRFDEWATVPHRWSFEITDTFGGEANYSWVRREDKVFYAKTFTTKDVAKALRKWGGFANQKTTVTDHGDTIEVRPRGCNVVMFAYMKENEVNQGNDNETD